MNECREELFVLLQEELNILRKLFSHITYQQIQEQSLCDVVFEAEKEKLVCARKEILKKQRKIYARLKKERMEPDVIGEGKWLLDQILELRTKIKSALLSKCSKPQIREKVEKKKLMVQEAIDDRQQ